MPNTSCNCCFGSYWWHWEEAFDKFGFNDGDGQVMTDIVVGVLETAGYTVEHEVWGLHNDIIRSIRKDGIEQIPETAEVGYDDPRNYLPPAIVDILDERLPEDGEVRP